jgi:hypothetical protein
MLPLSQPTIQQLRFELQQDVDPVYQPKPQERLALAWQVPDSSFEQSCFVAEYSNLAAIHH